MENISDEKLFDYIDGLLGDEEAKLIKQAVSASAALQKRLEVLRLGHDLASSAVLMKAPEALTSQVMSKLDDVSAIKQTPALNRLLPLGFGLFSMLLLFYAVSQLNGVTPVLNYLFDVKWQGWKLSLDWPWAQNLATGTALKVIVFIYMFLVLLLIDKAVLRPLFKSRRRAASF